MAELLALTGFWIFLYLLFNGLIFYGFKEKIIGFTMAGTVLSLALAFYSLSIGFSVAATNFMMVGLCIISMVTGLALSLYGLKDVVE
ncbi:hypothetical protein AKJ54_00655 [candidate division MSBL1 archaeon SCGC-AAA382K21]|uniref:Uncharacterized protein n=1 Tax=candidate division MSBL1 archaeon SCGC-AAA382K21 TaxID=1698283 RepID=A0A133VL16_9EURY|nr:hypothetical protein AKJ54_00655 [candidate division MSBL1 archaeon SCGC-AAA382K21]